MKSNFIYLFIFVLIINDAFAQDTSVFKVWKYPDIRPDTAIDYYYGKKVIDPFRNLEKTENEAIKLWIKAQNELYDTIIYSITSSDSLSNEAQYLRNTRKKWVDYPRIGGKRIFYSLGFTNDNSIERLAYLDTINKEQVEIYNTKEINEKNNSIYSFNYYEPSNDGKYIAFGISPNGSEKANIYIINVEKKKVLPEIVEHSFAGNIQWLPNDSGFFYIQDKEIKTIEDKNTPFEDSKVKYHKLYSDPRNDKEIFSRILNKEINLEKTDWPMLFIFPNSDKVLLNVTSSLYNAIYYAKLNDVINQPNKSIVWKKICDKNDKITNDVIYNNNFFGLDFKNNPNGQIIVINLEDYSQKIIFEAKGFSLDEMILTNKNLYVSILDKGTSRLFQINPINYKTDEIKLPFKGGLRLETSFSTKSFCQPNDKLLFTLTGYNRQWCDYICDEYRNISRTNVLTEIQYLKVPLDIVVEEIEVPSHDGTMVPLSIVYKNGIQLNNSNYTIIEAYGAYGKVLKPEFKRNRLLWLKHGGIYAVAHVRGGGEKGDEWYRGGFKATKSNSWKDLIACAEYMIKHKYTTPYKLAVIGASAGGITVGRAITERPELFKAAVIYSGNLNTIRTETSFNKRNIEECGTVNDSVEFQYLYNMDTYHHIKEGVKYPSILFTSGMNDARVAVWEPAKTVARFQKLNSCDNIILFRVEDKGHFDYPSDAEIYSFLFWQLGNPDFKLKERDFFTKPLRNK